MPAAGALHAYPGIAYARALALRAQEDAGKNPVKSSLKKNKTEDNADLMTIDDRTIGRAIQHYGWPYIPSRR